LSRSKDDKAYGGLVLSRTASGSWDLEIGDLLDFELGSADLGLSRLALETRSLPSSPVEGGRAIKLAGLLS